jgi:hypothetical protein
MLKIEALDHLVLTVASIEKRGGQRIRAEGKEASVWFGRFLSDYEDTDGRGYPTSGSL